MSDSGPRVYNGANWESVIDAVKDDNSEGPIPPVLGGDGNIFITIPSFRDGKRCGTTLKSIFENAKEPSKVFVGLIEQNDSEDRFCLEEYCSHYGFFNTIKRDTIRMDTVKVTIGDGRDLCPYYDNVRLLAFHNKAAKGPTYAKSLNRKLLKNEEFCMQVDAHTKFATGWDTIVKNNWMATNNEFAVLSTTPATASEMEKYAEGGDKFKHVPKQCFIPILEHGIPLFKAPGAEYAANLEKPILSHTWSSGFSFAKCHLEESAPNDPYIPYVMHAEQFTKFARFWTRGYDVYTPTENIVYTEYRVQPDGHGINEWYRGNNAREKAARDLSVHRMKLILQLPSIVDSSNYIAQANLGIYGLGKRRNLEQLNEFAGINLLFKEGTSKQNIKCANFEWVPYDTSISPVENLYTNPDDLDSQPEFPLRTQLVYYKNELLEEEEATTTTTNSSTTGNNTTAAIEEQQRKLQVANSKNYPFPSTTTLTSFWILGLILWYIVFGGTKTRKIANRKQGGGNGKEQQLKKKKQETHKDV